MLDWNVVKYLIKPRERSSDVHFKEVIFKQQKYAVPFCEAHIRDVLPSYSESNKERVLAELDFLNHLSKGKALGFDNNENIFVADANLMTLFHEIRNETKKDLSIMPSQNPQTVYKVDMKKLDPAHPLKPLFDKTNGVYDPYNMSNFLNELSEVIFNDVEIYNNFRKYTQNLERDLRTNNTNLMVDSDVLYFDHLIYHMDPLIQSFHVNDTNTLSSNWKTVATQWCKIYSDGRDNLPFGKVFEAACFLLDFHPLFKDTLKKKKNTLDNITRDSKVLYYATRAKFFITEDKTLYKKANFLFEVFDLDVNVLKIDEFLAKVN